MTAITWTPRPDGVIEGDGYAIHTVREGKRVLYHAVYYNPTGAEFGERIGDSGSEERAKRIAEKHKEAAAG
jgi:hypothetical protein